MFNDINTPSSTANTKPKLNQPNSMGDGQKKRRRQVKDGAAGKLSNSEINQFLKMVHTRAKDADGKFVIASFGQDPAKVDKVKPKITHHKKRAINSMVKSVRSLSKDGHRNVYMPLAVMRSDLEPGKKGQKSDVVAVLGLVMDFDAIDVDADLWKERLDPFEPTMVLETSSLPEPSFQCFFIFDQPLEPAQADRLASMLTIHCGCDSGSKDISHVWRVPGTQNWPNRKKVKEYGRPTKPQRVKTIIKYDDTRLVNADEMERNPAAIVVQDKPSSVDTNSDKKAPVKLAVDCKNLPQIDLDELWGLGGACAKVPDWIRQTILTGEHPSDPHRYASKSEAVFAVTCSLAKHHVPDKIVAAILLNKKFEISKHIYEQQNPQKYAVRQISRAKETTAPESLLLSPSKPRDSALQFRSRKRPTIMHYNGEFLAYDGAAYAPLEDETIQAEISAFLDEAVQKAGKSAELVPFSPNISKINEVLRALKNLTHKPKGQFSPPCWLDGIGPPPNEILACPNGLLHLPTMELLPSNSQFFTLNALDFDYDPNAPEPKRWLQFLESLWPNDSKSISLLQDIFGYLLLPDTSLQKIFMMVGPTRSGKGTLARLLSRLVGKGNVCGPTLSGMATQFGLQPLIGKQIALISDMRMGKNTDLATVSENLLRISGEDGVTVNRKFKSVWEGTLSVRFLILTNILPNFSEASGALANRFVPLVMKESFLGKEDPHLFDNLVKELPGILNWAIAGWKWLKAMEEFDLPESSQIAIGDMVRLGAPVQGFIKDRCTLKIGARVFKDELFGEWKDWCENVGYPYPSNKANFSRNLMAAAPNVAVTRPRTQDDNRAQVYENIQLRSPGVASRPQASDEEWSE